MDALISAFALVLALAASAAGVGSTSNDAELDALRGRTVLVDPGHNGDNANHQAEINRLVPAGGFEKPCDTTGTATNDESLTEPAFNWDVAKRLSALLRESGAKVVLTRKSNAGVGPCVNQRAAIGNEADADVAISIHADGGPPGGSGFHVIHPGYIAGYTTSIVQPSDELARDVRKALDDSGHQRADYIGHAGLDQRTDLGGLNLSEVPKVLTELGNMRNSGDARMLKSEQWRESTARALRSGLAAWLKKNGAP
jgi:N-acetylmuramoyl-L-alanine amidase